jgi:pyridoxine 5-phosphate synthase
MEVKPTQVTLVPDAVDALTSNAGWDTIKNQDFLKEVIKEFKSVGIRTSIFVDPVLDQIEGAFATGTDRIELYTEAYASEYTMNREKAIAPYVAASEMANELGLGINAGHDLSLENVTYFTKMIPSLLEVSIGHALICESLYLGFENVIPMYLQRLSH